MDRSFLSQPEVISASRQFVCIRLTTYENASEAKLLKSICPTGSGELENTVFAILSVDGKKTLTRPARSPSHAFDNATRMAETMERIARSLPPKRTADQSSPELPTVANVRLALDVAACDRQPLVILFAQDQASRRELTEKLKPLAWSDELRGRFVYAESSTEQDLAPIAGARAAAGFVVVQPDRFGLKGTVLKQVPGTTSGDELAQAFREAASKYQPQVETFRAHIQTGRLAGAFWETKLPVTDPMERQARDRTRREEGKGK
jgi:hypothetical protein